MEKIPQVFVIAPKEFPERRKATEEHLKSFGIEPIMFSGLYGKDVRLSSGRSSVNNIYTQLTEGRIVLALNHWFLWNHIVMAQIPEAIVFEDDVLLPSDFVEFFKRSVSLTPGDWEMVYLAITYPERILDGRIAATKVSGHVWRHRGARTWDGMVDGTHAYMMTLEGARKAISRRFILDEPIDRWLSAHVLLLLKTYIWYPSPIKQRTGTREWKSVL
jgi:glycosyl transferase family 25